VASSTDRTGDESAIPREISTKAAGGIAVSWIDTAALALILWSGVSGYLKGIRRAFLQLLILLCAALAAGVYHQSLMVYLRQEWQADALLVAVLGQKAQDLVPVVLLDDAISVAMLTEDTLAEAVLSAVAALSFFLLTATLLSLLLQIRDGRKKTRELPEGQKMTGLFLGVLQGLVLAFLLGAAIDVMLLVATASPLVQDLSASYLRLLTENIRTGVILLLKAFA